jgi:hypothetical protein
MDVEYQLIFMIIDRTLEIIALTVLGAMLYNWYVAYSITMEI